MWHTVEKAAIFDEEDQEEEENKDSEDLETRNKRAKHDKGKSKATKGKRCCKMLTKAEKNWIIEHVKSLNAMVVAAVSLTEAVCAISNH